MKLATAYAPIAACLARVDSEIRSRTDPRIAAFAGGKRLRPALLLFSAHAFGGRVCPDATVLAAAVEMVHAASLIHDDVIDSSLRRRDGPALHRLLGTKPAVILADYLFVQGLAMLESIRAQELAHPLIREVRTMCEGQWLEMNVDRGESCTKAAYQEILEKKTAALFAFCCRTGGILRDAPTDELSRLDSFGRSFGLCYQLLDDCRDLAEQRPGAITRAVTEWGGTRYLRKSAREAAQSARAALAELADATERRGLTQTLSYVMEV